MTFSCLPPTVPEFFEASPNVGVLLPSGDKILKVRPRMAAGPHRVLTIEVWHQTSGGKGKNILREVLMASAREDSLGCRAKSVSLLR